MAALNEQKQTQAQQQQQQQQQGERQKMKADIESGTDEKWNEGNIPSKPIRRKFSRTVPYETEIDGGAISPDDSVSVIVLHLEPQGSAVERN